MSTSAATGHISRVFHFWDATIGKKALMAVTGLIWFGYVMAHLLGNLQLFTGDPDKINGYAHLLHANPGPLWVARLVLIAAVVLHAKASIELALLRRAARPIAYVKKQDVPSAFAGRTMIYGGLFVGFFMVFHVLHLTTGNIVPLAPEIAEHSPNVYANVIAGFQNPLISGIYIVAMVFLGLHLFHGIWSMVQTLGFSHPRYTPMIKKAAAVLSFLIAAGNISIPLAVMAGIVK